MAASFRFAADCVALFRQITESSSFQLEQDDAKCHAYAVGAITTFAVQQISFLDLICLKYKRCSEMVTLQKDGVLGLRAAVDAIELSIENIDRLPGGASCPDLPFDIRFSFLLGWEAIFMTKLKTEHHIFLPTTLERFGRAGIATYITFFCDLAEKFVDEGFGAEFKREYEGSLFNTSGFWISLVAFNIHHPFETETPTIARYIARQDVQEKMLRATTALQVHLAGLCANGVGPDSPMLDIHLDHQAMVIAAQSACYAIITQQAYQSGNLLNELEIAKWVGPGIRAMTVLLQSGKDRLPEKESYKHARETWDVLSVACKFFYVKIGHGTSSEQTPGSRARRPEYDSREFETIFKFCNSLMEFDIALAQILLSHRELWGRVEYYRSRGPVPLMASVISAGLIVNLGEDLPLDRDILYPARHAIFTALETSIKVQLVYSEMPPAAHDLIGRLHRESEIIGFRNYPQDANSESEGWVRGICLAPQIFLDSLMKSMGLLTEPSTEKAKMMESAALLGMLYAASSYEDTLVKRTDKEKHTRYLELFSEHLLHAHLGFPVLVAEEGGEQSEPLGDELALKKVFNSVMDLQVEEPSEEQQNCAGVYMMILESIRAPSPDQSRVEWMSHTGIERRRNRAKALALRACCNVTCTAIPLFGKAHVSKRQCSGCHKQHYCSAACQKTAWREHKKVCKLLKEGI